MTVKLKAKKLAAHMHLIRQELYDVDKFNPETSEFLSVQETYALLSLGLNGRMTMTQLAKSLRLSLSSVTALADKLQQKDYILRSRSQDDRRVVHVELTAPGKGFFELLEDARRKLTLRILNALPPDEQDTLLRLIGKITATFEQHKSKG